MLLKTPGAQSTAERELGFAPGALGRYAAGKHIPSLATAIILEAALGILVSDWSET